MSADTFRAELQALVQAYDEHGGKWPQENEDALHAAVDHARTLLAQPEGEGLTIDELLALRSQQFKDDLAAVSRITGNTIGHNWAGVVRFTLDTGALDFARAVEVAVLSRHGLPTPQPPADRVVAASVESLCALSRGGTTR